MLGGDVMKLIKKISGLLFVVVIITCFAISVHAEDSTSLYGISSSVTVSEEKKIPVSCGLNVIAAQNDMALAGIKGNELCFSADRFACAMNLSDIDYIVITRLPDAVCGSLYIGSEGVSLNQKISAHEIGLMTFEESSVGSGNNASFDLQEIERVKDEGYGHPTEFEVITVIMLLYFNRENIDFGVIEVGLGGRLDSTNVITPDLCVITNIGLDHTDFLGNTMQSVAAEKAGIIKENVPVISFNQKPQVKKVLEEKAKEKNCTIYFMDDFLKNYSYEIKDNKSYITLEFTDLFTRPIKTKLNFLGEFQIFNAAISTYACKLINPSITEEQIEQGLSTAFLPGRFEIVEKDDSKKIPTLIMDGAHTKDSVTLTFNTYRKI